MYIIANVGVLARGIAMSLMFDEPGRRRTISASIPGRGIDRASRLGVIAIVATNALWTGAWTSAYPAFTEFLSAPPAHAGVGFPVG